MSIEQDVLERLRQLPPERQREVLTFAESLQSKSVHEDRSSQQEFEALAEQWRDATMMLSSPTKAAMHPSYQRIIGMGQPVAPLILQELERRPDHWFWALHAITGEDPAHSTDDVDAATDAWLNWGAGERVRLIDVCLASGDLVPEAESRRLSDNKLIDTAIQLHRLGRWTRQQDETTSGGGGRSA